MESRTRSKRDPALQTTTLRCRSSRASSHSGHGGSGLRLSRKWPKRIDGPHIGNEERLQDASACNRKPSYRGHDAEQSPCRCAAEDCAIRNVLEEAIANI